MKRKNLFFLGLLSSSFLLLVMSSCKKDSNDDGASNAEIQKAIEVSVNHENAVKPFSDMYGTVLTQFDDLASSMGRAQSGRISGINGIAGPSCYAVSVVPANILQWPKTVTWDFNVAGCTGIDGLHRSGKIISTFSESFLQPGATVTTTFENYIVDSFEVTGTIRYTNQFSKTNNDTVYAIKVDYTDAKITHVRTGFWSEINGSLTYQLVKVAPNNFNPITPFTTDGSLSGQNSIGFSWNAVTTKPVLRDFSCLWPKSGVITFSWNNNADKASLDYGDGTCDNKAEISYKGFKKTISL